MSSAINDIGTCYATTPTTESKKKQGGWCGQQNYTEGDIYALLSIFDKHVSTGKNDWSPVTAKYNKYATKNTCTTRGRKRFCFKSRRLAATKKPTGEPSCLKTVRRAKKSRDITTFRAPQPSASPTKTTIENLTLTKTILKSLP